MKGRCFGPDRLDTIARIVASGGATPLKITRMRVSNGSGSAATITISVGTDSVSTRVYEAVNVPAGTALDLKARITLAPGERAWAYASASGRLVLTVNGEGGFLPAYYTAFSTVQDPVVDDGNWIHNSTNHAVPAVAANGLITTQTGNDLYDDAYIYRTGFGTDYRVTTPVHHDSPPEFHEVEQILRVSDTSTTVRLYECLWPRNGSPYGCQIVRWDDADSTNLGQYTYLAEFSHPGIAGGDVLEGEIVGNIITMRKNGTTVGSVDVSAGAGAGGTGVYATGGVGVSVYLNDPAADRNKFTIRTCRVMAL